MTKVLKKDIHSFLKGKLEKAAELEIRQLLEQERCIAADFLTERHLLIMTDTKINSEADKFLIGLVEKHGLQEDEAFYRGFQAAMSAGMFKKESASIREIIDRAGGERVFSKVHKIPFNTVQRWYHNKEFLPDWLVELLNRIS